MRRLDKKNFGISPNSELLCYWSCLQTTLGISLVGNSLLPTPYSSSRTFLIHLGAAIIQKRVKLIKFPFPSFPSFFFPLADPASHTFSKTFACHVNEQLIQSNTLAFWWNILFPCWIFILWDLFSSYAVIPSRRGNPRLKETLKKNKPLKNKLILQLMLHTRKKQESCEFRRRGMNCSSLLQSALMLF